MSRGVNKSPARLLVTWYEPRNHLAFDKLMRLQVRAGRKGTGRVVYTYSGVNRHHRKEAILEVIEKASERGFRIVNRGRFQA